MECHQSQSQGRRWDIFCRVVDNLGDVGVSFRLARQLAQEYSAQVRYWLDDLSVLQRLETQLDTHAARQWVQGVDVCRWTDPFPSVAPAEVVVEAFGSALPASYLDAMAKLSKPPAWINLEYLSAEDWVEDCHGLPSPHPRLPLTQYFFYPGFTDRTGGLLREGSLLSRRDAFRADAAARRDFWEAIGVPDDAENALTVSMFNYPAAPLEALLSTWRDGERPVRCVVPVPVLGARAAAWLGLPALKPGERHCRGGLEIVAAPFLSPDDYDRLLWACDLNFVRGEDSFVRAQWAGRPLVWQIYPQAEGAHWPKLEAFLDRYGSVMAPDTKVRVSAFWHAWNGDGEVCGTWAGLAAELDRLQTHANAWSEHLSEQGDLAAKLVQFSEKLV